MTTSTDAGSFDRRLLLGAAGLAALAANRAVGGPLTPPAGAVTPSGKTLLETEPRTAINAVNTPGDATSVYRITTPGSYYLTSNIVAPAVKSGIKVSVGGVTIDLCGFEVLGLGITGGADGTINGVNVTSSVTGVRIFNGTVRNWSGPGVRLGLSGLLEDVRFVSCGLSTFQPAVDLAGKCVMQNCTVSGGAYTGIDASASCVLRACSVSDAGEFGISAASACTLEGCSVSSSGGTGILADEGSMLIGCTSSFNGENGFRLTAATAHGCAAQNNNTGAGFSMNGPSMAKGCYSHRNQVGFSYFNGAVLIDNTATNNSQYGFSGGTSGFSSRLEGNTARSNPTGFYLQAAGNFFARNTAALSSTNNWNIAAGNFCLVIDAVGSAAAIVGNSGGASPGSTNPNANYSL